jgi:hypothetical protein
MDVTTDSHDDNTLTTSDDNTFMMEQGNLLSLQARRETLLRSGCYVPNDEVIKIIDARLADLRAGHH